MSWIKQVFTDFQTVITAKFLNDLQDQIIRDETTMGGLVTGVKGNSEASYRSGNVNITKANVGLGNVDNTSDTNKPVSKAQQNALNGKVDKVTGKGLSTNDYTNAEKQRVADSALQLDDLNRQINHFDDNLPGTVQTVNFGADGKPSSVVHTKSGVTVRTDSFTWGSGTVTETRTTADGSYITMVTDLTTLVTTISEIQEAS